jgi:hypothetical protein
LEDDDYMSGDETQNEEQANIPKQNGQGTLQKELSVEAKQTLIEARARIDFQVSATHAQGAVGKSLPCLALLSLL